MHIHRIICLFIVALIARMGMAAAEPVAFADDFMRSGGERGLWQLQRGAWALQSAWDADPRGNARRFANVEYAQNPFAWVGRATGPAGALCTVGRPAWEDYTFTASVRPPRVGAVGVVVNMPDPLSGLLVRWSPANDRGPRGNSLQIGRLEGNQFTPLATSPGGYLPGQWYKVAVSTTAEMLRVAIDNQPRLELATPAPARGGVGLYAEGTEGVAFDDVTVYGHALNTALIAERQAARINERFSHDREMSVWSSQNSDWPPMPGQPGWRAHRREFYGDHALAMTLTPIAGAEGQLDLVLCGDGAVPTNGYRLAIRRADGKTQYTLYRNDAVLADKAGDALTVGEEYALRFLRAGNTLRLQVDGAVMLEAADPQPLAGVYPAYRAAGCLARVGEVTATGANLLDYPFTTAPVDWLGEGAWAATVRWACAPHWSFLGGWSRGDVVLWHKARFAGDQTLEAFVGVKQEYPRQRDMYEIRARDMAVTLCGDGRDPRNGYAAIAGAPGKDGTPNRRLVLLRNGVEVASTPGTLPQMSEPDSRGSHHSWFHLVLRKRGSDIDFNVDFTDRLDRTSTLSLSYHDPEPLDGGAPAIWSHDNGIVIARVRLCASSAPQPRPQPQVTIDDPWYPEWANIGQPLALDFPNTWSATGKPVALQVAPALVPEGEAADAVTVDDRHVRFTPRVPGEHWYQIRAADGQERSAAVHLSLPVFDPVLGRDETHALVLYRFDEGTGAVVHDHGIGAPAADLTIPANANTQWLPGQGLRYDGPAPLATAAGVPKLMAIAQARACTVEFWLSNETIVPRTDGTGGQLSWGTGNAKRNFAINTWWHWFAVVPPGAVTGQVYARPMQYFTTDQKADHFVFRNSLHHYAITWDGKTTSTYRDGELIGTNDALEWNPEKWTADLPLLLGNQDDGQTNYQGTYYLVALHDRCFTPAEVHRQYQAGPSAK